MASKLKLTELLYPTSTTPAITINADDTVTFGAPTTTITNLSATSITDSGNLTFTGTGNRIRGDFSNATLVNRVTFQTSTANSATSVQAIPNGTGNTATFLTANGTDVDNASIFQFQATNTDNRLNANKLGSGTYLPMTFYTGGSEAMRITTDRNVGIGTVSPGYRLDVAAADITANFGYAMRLRSNATAGAATLQFTNSGVTTENGYIRVTDTGLMSLSNKAYITSAGDVGIGTSSPTSTLTVQGTPSGGTVSFKHAGSNSFGTILTLETIGGTDDPVLSFKNYNGGVPTYYGIAGTDDGALGFRSNASTGGFGDERMRITSSGNLLVGTTSGTEFKLRVNRSGNLGICTLTNSDTSGLTYDQFQIIVGQSASSAYMLARWYVAAGASPQFAFRGDGQMFATTTSIASISDARVKENVRNADDGLQTILNLRTVRFDFKEGFGNNRKNQLGFIAQEVETVFPDAVDVAGVTTEDSDAYKSVAPGTLIPVLVKAIQELKAEFDAYKLSHP